MKSISNHTKATLFLYDITDPSVKAKREQSITIQQFSYECSRQRDAAGIPYGSTITTLMHITIKSLPSGYMKDIYKCLTTSSISKISILFNATFECGGGGETPLADYESALVAEGYVVDIAEEYGTPSPDDACGRQAPSQTTDMMMTSITFLLETITYVGDSNYSRKLHINI